MKQVVEAIYEEGVFKPTQPLVLPNGQRVLLDVRAVEGVSEGQQLGDRESELLRLLEADGALEQYSSSSKPPSDFLPVVVAGEPISQTILKGRR